MKGGSVRKHVRRVLKTPLGQLLRNVQTSMLAEVRSKLERPNPEFSKVLRDILYDFNVLPVVRVAMMVGMTNLVRNVPPKGRTFSRADLQRIRPRPLSLTKDERAAVGKAFVNALLPTQARPSKAEVLVDDRDYEIKRTRDGRLYVAISAKERATF